MSGDVEQVSWITWHGNGRHWHPWMVFGGVSCEKAYDLGRKGEDMPEWFGMSPLVEAYKAGVSARRV